LAIANCFFDIFSGSVTGDVDHCPIFTAANVCSKLCDAEMEVFRAILGEGVTIERAEHMVAWVVQGRRTNTT
jgi:predicted ArsR family transcriptional regulator